MLLAAEYLCVRGIVRPTEQHTLVIEWTTREVLITIFCFHECIVGTALQAMHSMTSVPCLVSFAPKMTALFPKGHIC